MGKQKIDRLPDSISVGYCDTCKCKHDWARDEYMSCVPPAHVLQFGHYTISREYRDALLETYPHYDTEEVVGSFLGYGVFPSQNDWEAKQQKDSDEDDTD